MKLKSVFENSELMPAKYTCDGGNISPKLIIEDVPKEAKTLTIILEDRDAPMRVWAHWVIFNIPADVGVIEENCIPEGSIQATNDFGDNNYRGPCPDAGNVHRYEFHLYAVNKVLKVESTSKKADVERVQTGCVVASTILTGEYSRD
ncbi:MAG: YbhB/YbcL family Raf kinase inhibitor-like protein [Nitrospiraceae bacterium]|nr:YbhB/YbcL family Raf kinase inhibitor-like protein [Nitrospiraceae bacterium]